jgi:prepilin-type N-terminal cleavage/methylation domain-containing protein
MTSEGQVLPDLPFTAFRRIRPGDDMTYSPIRSLHRHLDQHRSDESGFTLLELMVVLTVLAALLAMVIPTVLSYENKVQDRAAQARLRYALTAEKVVFVDGLQYTAVVPDLLQVEPSLSFTGVVPPPSVDTVGVTVNTTSATNDTVVVASKSQSGICWYVKDVGVGPSAQTLFAKEPGCAGSPSYTTSW